MTLALVTHDSGGITQLDIDLARAIDDLSAGRSGPTLTGRRSADR